MASQQITSRSAILLALLWPCGLLVAGILFLPPVWDDTDDFRMSVIAAGIGSVEGPSPILVYAHVLLGMVLKSLYQVAPETAWYGWFLVSCHLISQWGIGYSLLKCGLRREVLLVMLAGQIALTSYLWTHLQFTTTAALLAVAGGCLLFTAARETVALRRAVTLLTACALIVLSSLVRLQSTQLIGLLVCFPFLVTLFRHRMLIRPAQDLLLTIAAVAVFAGLVYWNRAVYEADPQLAEFRKQLSHIGHLNNDVYLRLVSEGQLSDRNELRSARRAMADCSLSPNDLICLLAWYYPDEVTFSMAKLQKLDESLTEIAPFRFAASMAITVPRILIDSNLFLLLAGISLGVVIRLRPDTGTTIVIAATWGLGYAVMTFLLVSMKLPPRVFISVASVCCVLTVQLSVLYGEKLPADEGSPPDDRGRPRHRNSQVWLTVMMLCSLIITGQHWLNSRKIVAERVQVEQTLRLLIERNDTLQVGLVPFPFAWLDPLKSYNWLNEWRYVYLDGHQRSPRQNAIVNRHVGMPLNQAILEVPGVRIVVGRDQILANISEFYREHADLAVKFSEVQSLPWGTVRRVEVRRVEVDPIQGVPSNAVPFRPEMR